MITPENVREAMSRTGVNIDISKIPDEGNLTEHGLDSLDIYDLILEMQEVTGLEVPDDDVEKLNSINNIVSYFS
ncbi:phosphopantetheine-binding protein [Aestuariirhabdus haliotis]|uniref:phosphopantetheine-binding protein n=1 Tax=Aestuariirhabdus haliotis TaxID=2918751 RepID=UPI0020BD8D9B|nr:phosphopantetheine-binding protein [Aestuariirhabdus haliotis]MCL6419720.1 phosphopantetheine-binding protein [Aestuariirhabdus haliotis]